MVINYPIEQSLITKYFESIENQLLGSERIRIDFSRAWISQFTKVAGIYLIFDKEVLVYVGETGIQSNLAGYLQYKN